MTGGILDKPPRRLSLSSHSHHHRRRQRQRNNNQPEEEQRRGISGNARPTTTTKRTTLTLLLGIGVVLGLCVNSVTAKPSSSNKDNSFLFGSSVFGGSNQDSSSSSQSSERYPYPPSNFFNSNEHDDDFDPDEHMETVVNIIVAIAIFVFVAIFAFLLCLCCPICILAKMRSRRRGVVYRSTTTPAPNGTTVTTERTRGGGTVITVSRAQNQMASPSPATQPLTSGAASNNGHHPQLIAIPNNANQAGKPYPVQESVTVVPLIQHHQPQQPQFPGVPSHPHHGYHQQSPYAMPTTTSVPSSNQQYPSSELPPPYPGLPRDIMDPATNNLPYNPYFTEDSSASPSAPILKH